MSSAIGMSDFFSRRRNPDEEEDERQRAMGEGAPQLAPSRYSVPNYRNPTENAAAVPSYRFDSPSNPAQEGSRYSVPYAPQNAGGQTQPSPSFLDRAESFVDKTGKTVGNTIGKFNKAARVFDGARGIFSNIGEAAQQILQGPVGSVVNALSYGWLDSLGLRNSDSVFGRALNSMIGGGSQISGKSLLGNNSSDPYEAATKYATQYSNRASERVPFDDYANTIASEYANRVVPRINYSFGKEGSMDSSDYNNAINYSKSQMLDSLNRNRMSYDMSQKELDYKNYVAATDFIKNDPSRLPSRGEQYYPYQQMQDIDGGLSDDFVGDRAGMEMGEGMQKAYQSKFPGLSSRFSGSENSAESSPPRSYFHLWGDPAWERVQEADRKRFQDVRAESDQNIRENEASYRNHMRMRDSIMTPSTASQTLWDYMADRYRIPNASSMKASELRASVKKEFVNELRSSGLTGTRLNQYMEKILKDSFPDITDTDSARMSLYNGLVLLSQIKNARATSFSKYDRLAQSEGRTFNSNDMRKVNSEVEYLMRYYEVPYLAAQSEVMAASFPNSFKKSFLDGPPAGVYYLVPGIVERAIAQTGWSRDKAIEHLISKGYEVPEMDPVQYKKQSQYYAFKSWSPKPKKRLFSSRDKGGR